MKGVRTGFPTWAEMPQEEALHRVCVRLARVSDGGKISSTPFWNMVAGRGIDLPVEPGKRMRLAGTLDPSRVHGILARRVK